jgi:murein DD-endopeptidase MepM/ murein hydrolase activator NlpD
MKLTSALGALVLLLLPAQVPAPLPEPWHPQEIATAAAEAPRLHVMRGVVGRSATLASLLGTVLSSGDVHALAQAARPVYDLARIAAGRPYGLSVTSEGLLAAFTYAIDDLRTLEVARTSEGYAANLVSRSYDVRPLAVAGTIRSSLFAAMEDAGEADQLALDLAGIFAWDVDFNTELQPGDSFRVAVEKMYLDGRFARYGRILAAELIRGARVLKVVSFGDSGYYRPDGTPHRKAFLRSPLKFSRISSGFSRSRLHPILQALRPHLGVDYAARAGTPVMAAGDGVVVLAGWLGAYGKAVRIRHANGYETLYGHLSRINVRAGQRISQGALIGAVGATGLATGPHLDYRMTRNGVFLNPLKVLSPPAEPIPPQRRVAFEAARAEQLALLEGPATSATVADDRPTDASPSALTPE